MRPPTSDDFVQKDGAIIHSLSANRPKNFVLTNLRFQLSAYCVYRSAGIPTQHGVIHMRRGKEYLLWLLVISAVLLAQSPARAQSASDLSGLWDGVGNSSNLVQSMKAQGKEGPFTAYGAERLKKVDKAQKPNGFWLPTGAAPALNGPF